MSNKWAESYGGSFEFHNRSQYDWAMAGWGMTTSDTDTLMSMLDIDEDIDGIDDYIYDIDDIEGIGDEE